MFSVYFKFEKKSVGKDKLPRTIRTIKFQKIAENRVLINFWRDLQNHW